MTCKHHRKGVNEGLGRGRRRRGPPSARRPAGLPRGCRRAGAGGGTVPYVTRGTRAAGGDYVSGTSAPVAQDTSRRHRAGRQAGTARRDTASPPLRSKRRGEGKALV